jgi:hypothetical protein
VKNALLFLLLITLFSCSGATPQEKAEHSVETYMLSYLDFPKSYEGIEFEKLAKDTLTGNTWYISHMYRSKNKKGEIAVAQRVFFLDTAFQVKKVMTLKEYSDLTAPRE